MTLMDKIVDLTELPKMEKRDGEPSIYGLRRALQIELGIQETSNSFGPTTYSLCPTIAQGSEGNLVYIVQGGLWCKGYSPGGFNGYYGNGTYAAVKALKTDAGFPTASGNMQRDFMRALLDMSAFTCLSQGSEAVRTIQQQLNYDYYDYYQICPCDGLYNRDMNKMLIYALQKELGIPKSSATGTWGPTTISKCKEKSFSIGNSSPIVKLIRYALVCNGFSVSTSSSTYDSTLDTILKNFSNSLMINKPTNQCNYTVIKSLLSSNGDTSRSAKGCDTSTRLDQAKITTLKNNGYEVVGRYLTKVPNGLDKNMTPEEVELILSNGLSIFPIFQEYGGGNSAFSKTKGINNGNSAYNAAVSLGIPSGTIIYFAVDYDPQTTEIQNYVVPYFEGVCESLSNSNKTNKYLVGVYGTRNVCKILTENTSSLGIDNLFVSDASYGFSGNLGFQMPKKWDLDQFATDISIGSGNGKISIDKVAVSGIFNGFNYVTKNTTDREKIYNTLKQLSTIAMEHTNNNRQKSNLLVAQYLRKKSSSYTGSIWDITGGALDESYKVKADKVDQSHEYNFKDPLTGEKYDFYHLMATFSAVLYLSNIPGFDLNWEVVDPLVDIFAGWGGDLTTLSKDLDNLDSNGKIHGDLQTYANNLICQAEGTSRFPLVDYIADIDAVVMGYLISNDDIAELFKDYFMYDKENISKHRTRMFIRNAYGDLERFSAAVNTFSEGLGFPIPEMLDVLTYLKEAILANGEDLPERKYRDAGAAALINFVTNEFNSMR